MTENAELPLMIMGCDEHYCFPSAVAMFSALRAASKPLRVLVLSDRISSDSKKRLRRVAHRGGAASFSTLDVDLTAFRMRKARIAHLSPAAFSRILIPVLLPTERRCLWIDSDTLVRRDLVELWNTDLRGLPAGAVQCYHVPNVGAKFGIPYVEGVSDDPTRSYLNSGIMVIDLDRWRNENTDQAVSAFLQDHSTHLMGADQDILNAVLIERWEKLPGYWNDQESASHKSAEHRNGSKKIIRHFSGPQKPWNSGLFDPDVRRWIKAANACGFYSKWAFLFWRLMRLPVVLKGTATNWLKRRAVIQRRLNANGYLT